MDWVIEVVTQHAKERTLALSFRWGLGARLVASPGADTDLLGTFCGCQERVGTPLDALRAKLSLGKSRWRLASEASFGPDPLTGLLASHHEGLALRDEELDRIWWEQAVTLDTNFRSQRCESWEEVERLARSVDFPTNALMLLGSEIRKGIGTWQQLRSGFSELGPCLLQTDMRNHLNRPRRFHLRRLGLRLVRRMRANCPICQCPGFGCTDVLQGLPCGNCGCPTSWVSQQVWTCQGCPYRESRPREDGLSHCDPGNCDVCNP